MKEEEKIKIMLMIKDERIIKIKSKIHPSSFILHPFLLGSNTSQRTHCVIKNFPV